MVKYSVLFEVRTKFLNIILMSYVLQRVNLWQEKIKVFMWSFKSRHCGITDVMKLKRGMD
jgi:hypothetical protein